MSAEQFAQRWRFELEVISAIFRQQPHTMLYDSGPVTFYEDRLPGMQGEELKQALRDSLRALD